MGPSLILALALMAPGPTQAQVPPPVHLPIETYPAALRRAIAPAVRESRARPADAKPTGQLGRLLHAWEQWDSAHEAYARAAALAPGDFQWAYLDGCVLERLARHAEAAAALERALAIDPAYLPARVKLAERLLDAGRTKESKAQFDVMLAHADAEPAARFGLGRIAAARGEHLQAVALFERALALFPEWGAAHYALALSLRALGRREEAARALEHHARYGPLWPALPDPVLAATIALRDDATAHLRRAESLADAEKLAEAAAAAKAALQLDPRLSVAHERLLTIYGRLGDWKRAELHYRAALAAGANLSELHYNYGVLQGQQEHWNEAERCYRLAIAANPLHARAHNNLGQILERTRGFDDALAEYRLAIDSEPTFRLARFNAGRALLALGRADAAVVELGTIIEPRDAETPRYLFGLAVALVRAGHREEGVARATEARALATRYRQADLAASIDAELARLR